MFDLGIAFIIVLETGIAVSLIFLCKGEINQKWRQASSRSKALSPCAKKEAIIRRKLQKTRRAYIKEALKEREHLNREMSSLDRLLKENLIDEHTYARYRKLLEMGYEQNRQQIRERHGFTKTSTLT